MALSMKQQAIHGGDIYRNSITLDASVNVNPYALPREVTDALHGAVETCGRYPDSEHEQLTQAVSRMLGTAPEQFLFGNGASELFLAIIHALKPKKLLLPVPSFYGYEYAASAADGELVFFELDKAAGFRVQDELLHALRADVELLFLANPNNPTGVLIEEEVLLRILRHCRAQGITVVLDECFLDFCPQARSMKEYLQEFPNLLLVRAFTKIFSIPGVRLGYLLCSDMQLRRTLRRHLPEWNVSGFAQAAGCACAAQTDYIKESVRCIENERRFLAAGLRQAGCQVLSGSANFLLVYSEQPLYEQLLKQGILIRDCANFRGLSAGYYRIAVKGHAENERLLRALGGKR